MGAFPIHFFDKKDSDANKTQAEGKTEKTADSGVKGEKEQDDAT